MSNKWKPIRKIAVAAVAAGVTWLALRLGVDLGAAEINEAAAGVVAVLAGYLTPAA